MSDAKSILDLPIRIWTPLKNTEKCVAQIGNLQFFFKGDTPMQAKKNAEDFRRIEHAKMTGDKAALKRLLADKKAREDA